MANKGAQGKIKAVWDPPTHEIWVDLAIEQVRADASKFRVKGLRHVFKIDELFRDVTATGDRAWSPTSGLMPPLYSQAFMTEDNVSLDSEEAIHEDVVECGNPQTKNTCTK
ncbi:hypothetical protein Dsin_002725 [Dipteronia sinensis]|uniref:Uncharacterized protein n=1 Tax=Dipteronia sinensis TaxID=43782 RepID=A0AAE0EJY7_9ROSI|nr:hypothetical protein Dsin_002725 [Dipteronia sinensis]